VGKSSIPGWQEEKQSSMPHEPVISDPKKEDANQTSSSSGSSTIIPPEKPITLDRDTAPADATAVGSKNIPPAGSTGSNISPETRSQISQQAAQRWDPAFKKLSEFKESLRQLEIKRREIHELSKALDDLHELSQTLRTPTSRELPDSDRTKQGAKQANRKKGRGSGDPLYRFVHPDTGEPLIPLLDEFGDPLLDEDGDPIMVPALEVPASDADDQTRYAQADVYAPSTISWQDAVRMSKEDPGLTIAGEALLSFYVATRDFAIPAPPKDFYAAFISPLARAVTEKLYLPMRYSQALIIAITHGESGYGRKTQNPDSNAQGFIQLIPGTRIGLQSIFGLPEWDERTSKDDIQMNLIYSKAYFSRLAVRLSSLGIKQRVIRNPDGTIRGEIEISAPLANKEAIIAALNKYPVMTNGNDFRLMLIIIFHAVGLGVSDLIARREALISRFLVCKHIVTALELHDMGIKVPIFKGSVASSTRRTQTPSAKPKQSTGKSNQNSASSGARRKKASGSGQAGGNNQGTMQPPGERERSSRKQRRTTGGSSGDPFLQFQSLYF
jgi:hypothetical protein